MSIDSTLRATDTAASGGSAAASEALADQGQIPTPDLVARTRAALEARLGRHLNPDELGTLETQIRAFNHSLESIRMRAGNSMQRRHILLRQLEIASGYTSFQLANFFEALRYKTLESHLQKRYEKILDTLNDDPIEKARTAILFEEEKAAILRECFLGAVPSVSDEELREAITQLDTKIAYLNDLHKALFETDSEYADCSKHFNIHMAQNSLGVANPADPTQVCFRGIGGREGRLLADIPPIYTPFTAVTGGAFPRLLSAQYTLCDSFVVEAHIAGHLNTTGIHTVLGKIGWTTGLVSATSSFQIALGYATATNPGSSAAPRDGRILVILPDRVRIVLNSGPHFHSEHTHEDTTGAVASEEILIPSIAVSDIKAVLHVGPDRTITSVEYYDVPGTPPTMIPITPNEQNWEAISTKIQTVTEQALHLIPPTSIPTFDDDEDRSSIASSEFSPARTSPTFSEVTDETLRRLSPPAPSFDDSV